MERLTVAFFHPSHTIGGGENLFGRVAAALAETGQVRTAIIDFPDGETMRAANSDKVENWSIHRKPGALDRNTIIVTAFPLFRHLVRWTGPNCQARITLWGIHPTSALAWFPASEMIVMAGRSREDWVLNTFYPFRRRVVRRAVGGLARRRGLWLMDGTNVRSTEAIVQCSMRDCPIVPVPMPDRPVAGVEPNREPGGALRFGWLGRLAEDKVPMLVRIMKDLDQAAAEVGVRDSLRVIGDGGHAAEARQVAERLQALRVEFVGTVPDTRLGESLGGLDGLFAMGTSALEGAARGLPTVLVDASYHAIPSGYGYRWLYETKDFDLGHVLRSSVPPGLSTVEIRARLLSREGARSASNQCYDYVLQNHSLAATCKIVSRLISQTEETVEQLDREGGAFGATWKLLGFVHRTVLSLE